MSDLGKWAVIDIETTGAHPLDDSVIDLGFLQFDGLVLEKKYSSLVKFDGNLSEFIKKLTGINDQMLAGAPLWNQVEPDLVSLDGHHLIAHNSDFEKNFLERYFEAGRFSDDSDKEQWHDSMLFLGLLFPERSSLNLESFIIDFGISDKELHRGFEDSLDLLKVILVAIELAKADSELDFAFRSICEQFSLKNKFWFCRIYDLSKDERMEIARQIDFDPRHGVKFFQDQNKKIREQGIVDSESKISLEFSGENVQKILSNESGIQKFLPQYKFRNSQKDLSLRVGQSLKNSVHSLIQAPTGTGKTLGYLIPSTLFSLEEGKQVLIATGTKALQNQAMEKDIPQLRKILGLDEDDLKVERLVGSKNHLCEMIFRKSVEEEDLFTQNQTFEDAFALAYFNLIFEYNTNHPKTPITRGDLAYVLTRKIKEISKIEKDIAVDFRSCTGHQCPYKDSCSYFNGLKRAKNADLILGNHSLMFSWPKGFPRPAHIIVDEAHRIENEATSALTSEFSQDGFENYFKSIVQGSAVGSLYYLLGQTEEEPGSSTQEINHIRSELQNTSEMMKDHMDVLPELIDKFFKKMTRYSSIYWNEVPMIEKNGLKDELSAAIFNHFESIKFLLETQYKLLLPYLGRWEASNIKDDNQLISLSRFEGFVGQLEDLLSALSSMMENRTDLTQSFKYHEDYGYSLEASPIDIGEKVNSMLLEPSASVIFTSATLANADGGKGTHGIEWVTGYKYLAADKRFKSGFYLPAPYDYKNKTKVFLCDDTPAMKDFNFVEDVLKRVTPLIHKLGGRSLLLFSAKTRFEVAREVLLKEFEGKIPLFIQGMGKTVVEDFRKAGHGILLGMESFGEGIDIPGEGLQFILIDKIPDIRMNLVTNERRDFYGRNFGNEFTDYFMAHRTRSLHQKLGRLLRTENDHGGVIIVDSRIKRWKKRTQDTFFELMEPYNFQRMELGQACEDVYDFITQ